MRRGEAAEEGVDGLAGDLKRLFRAKAAPAADPTNWTSTPPPATNDLIRAPRQVDVGTVPCVENLRTASDLPG
jgi:hypothetical protein